MGDVAADPGAGLKTCVTTRLFAGNARRLALFATSSYHPYFFLGDAFALRLATPICFGGYAYEFGFLLKKSLIASFLALGMTLSAQAADIVDTAVAAGSFKTLATALGAADLVGTLKGKGPFTVFAPTDEAFAKIPKADLEALLKDKKKLTAVLTYHVVPGKVMAADVKAGKVKTVQGSEVTISTTGGVTVNNAKVIKTDIAADNGVIHVIDTVIMPR